LPWGLKSQFSSGVAEGLAERLQKLMVSGEPEFDSAIAIKLLTEAKVDGCDWSAPFEVIARGPAEDIAVN
jgi:hypothetical protein